MKIVESIFVILLLTVLNKSQTTNFNFGGPNMTALTREVQTALNSLTTQPEEDLILSTFYRETVQATGGGGQGDDILRGGQGGDIFLRVDASYSTSSESWEVSALYTSSGYIAILQTDYLQNLKEANVAGLISCEPQQPPSELPDRSQPPIEPVGPPSIC